MALKEIRLSHLLICLGAISNIILFIVTKNIIILSYYIAWISILTARFLSGLGIFSTYALAVSFLYEKLSSKIKVDKNIAKKLNRLTQILAILVFMAIGILTIIGDVHTDMIMVVIGLALTFITFYIVPIWKEDEKFCLNESLIERIKSYLSNLSFKVKRGYYRYFTKEYLKVYSLEYIYLRTRLDDMRQRVGRYVLFTFIACTSVFPVLSAFLAYVLVRLIKIKEIGWLDKVILLVAIVFMVFYVSLMIFIMNISIPWYIVQGAYLIGIIISLAIFFYLALSL